MVTINVVHAHKLPLGNVVDLQMHITRDPIKVVRQERTLYNKQCRMPHSLVHYEKTQALTHHEVWPLSRSLVH
jgi:hypothetical protein